jgi:pimeloyl-ACP methyl ester carboxylesterase
MALVLKVALVALAAYALLCLGACALQERLIFYPQPPGPRLPAAPVGWQVVPMPLTGAGGVALEAWVVRPRLPGRYPVVVYFGGNAEEVSWMAELAPRFGEVALVLANYRGYGRSGGSPGEAALFADALAVHDAAIARDDVDPRRVVVHGRSLGSAVAVHVAASRPVAGAILTSPVDSVAALARRAFPWLPVERLLRHRFDALQRAPSVRVAALFIVGGRDRVVAPEHSRALHAAWGGPKRLVELADGDHLDVILQPGYWEAVAAFVAALPGASGQSPGASGQTLRASGQRPDAG